MFKGMSEFSFQISVALERDSTLSVEYLLSFVSARKWKSALGKKNAFLNDLPKDYDCLSHELLIVQSTVYEFSFAAMMLVSNRTKRNKMNLKFRSWKILFQ